MSDEIPRSNEHLGQLAFPNPYSTIHDREYGEMVYHENTDAINTLRVKLEGFKLPKDTCLILAGSDGKKERHIQSKMDLVFVRETNDGRDVGQELVDWYEKHYGKGSFLHDFDARVEGKPEVKYLNPDETNEGDEEQPLISHAHIGQFVRATTSIFPDRALNTIYVSGNHEIYTKAIIKVLDELKLPLVRRVLMKQLKEYKKAIVSGEYRGQKLFEVDEASPIGFEYYNEDPKSYSTGLKTPFLRAVQRKLDLLTSDLLLSKDNDFIFRFAANLPSNTIERMKYLQENGGFVIPDDVVDAYLWFLRTYHQAQEEYKIVKEKVTVKFDTQEFIQHKKAILRFVS